MNNLTGEQKRLSAELYEILRNDFVFYKHKFNTVDYSDKGKNSYSFPDVEKWHAGGVTFFVAGKMNNGSGESIVANFKVWSVLAKKEIYSGEFKVNKEVAAHT